MEALIIIGSLFVLYLVFRSKGHVKVDQQQIQKDVRQDVHTVSTHSRQYSAKGLSTTASFAERLARKIEPSKKEISAKTK